MNDKTIAPFEGIKKLAFDSQTIDRFQNALGNEQKARAFLSSLLVIARGNDKLLACDHISILNAAMKAAVLDLPLEPSLGWACIVPYGGKAEFQIMKQGFVQLAHRTGQYLKINTNWVYANQKIFRNQLTGDVRFEPEEPDLATRPIACFNYFLMNDGFSHVLIMTPDEIRAHADKYSPSWDRKNKCFYPGSFGANNFEGYCEKTVTKLNLKRHGHLSISVARSDDEEWHEPEGYINGSFSEKQPEPELESGKAPRQPKKQYQPPPEPTTTTPQNTPVGSRKPVSPNDEVDQVQLGTKQANEDFDYNHALEILVESNYASSRKEAEIWRSYMPNLSTKDQLISWARLMRGWIDLGETIGSAVKKSNAGEVPGG